TGVEPSSIAIGDLDGDGKPDLAIADGTELDVLLNTGKGVFAMAKSVISAVNASSVAIGDLDSDGKLDLALTNDADGTIAVLRNGGGATFGTAQTYNPCGKSALQIAVGDLNGDGKPDLVAGASGPSTLDGAICVLLNQGNGSFA